MPFDPSPGGPLQSLLAHEATHVVSYYEWGPPGTPLLGEGLAVWVADDYGGRSLAEWRKAPPRKGAEVARLLGPAFRKLPERETYPLAGILTGVLLEMVGREAFRDHLYPATPATWPEACRAAGTTPAKVQKAFAEAFLEK